MALGLLVQVPLSKRKKPAANCFLGGPVIKIQSPPTLPREWPPHSLQKSLEGLSPRPKWAASKIASCYQLRVWWYRFLLFERWSFNNMRNQGYLGACQFMQIADSTDQGSLFLVNNTVFMDQSGQRTDGTLEAHIRMINHQTPGHDT